MRMRWLVALIFGVGLAAGLSDGIQTPLVATPCQGFGNAAEIVELG